MKTAPKNKILIILTVLYLVICPISCTEENDEFIELTYGLSMNPELPRSGIKIKGDSHVYYCEEIMNLGNEHYLNNHTGKYKFYKSEQKVEFSKYKDLIIKNFSKKFRKIILQLQMVLMNKLILIYSQKR